MARVATGTPASTPTRAGLTAAVLEHSRALGRALLDLLYPPECSGCRRLGELFCAQCRQQVRPYPLLCCPSCGKPAPGRKVCAECAASPSPLQAILPATVFAHPIRPAIHDFKYEGARDLAQPLADWLVAAWRLHHLSADLIVPVPLHAQRERERGYNQSALLAKWLSAAVGVPVAPAELVRAVRTRPQVGLTQEQRRANIAGAFRCAGHVTDIRIVLVDDVCTTGSTLEACAQELKAAGAAAVWGLTVARPPYAASSALLPPDDPALPD
jgi:ComF family protein